MSRTRHSNTRRAFVTLAGLALLTATGCTKGEAKIRRITTPPVTGAAYDAVSHACAIETLSASNVYYVCDCAAGAAAGCVPGDDSNPGTSDAPFRTTSKAISTFNALAAGEAVVFCRGGAWDMPSPMTVYNVACRADSPCTMREYTPSWADPSTPNPLLMGPSGDNVIEFTDNAGANHDEGYRVHNLTLVGAGDLCLFFYNDVDDVDLCNLDLSGATIGVYVGDENPPDTASANPGDGKNERITLRGSYIHDVSQQGFLGHGYGLNVDSNAFDHCGTDSTEFLHSIYIDGQGADTHVGSNFITHSTHGPGGTCSGAPIVVHGVEDGITLEFNEIRFDVGEAQPGCWGMTIDAAYGGEAEGFMNAVIRGNRLVNPGNIAIGVSSCDTCLVEDNLVVQDNAFDSTGIAAPNRSRESIDLPLAAVTVRNNTIVGGGAQLTGVALGGEGTGHSANNNAIYSASADKLTCLSIASGATSDYDACFGGGGQVTLSDAHGVTGDPLFTGLSDGNYIPGTTSPLRGAADPATASPWAIDGQPRGTPPDIGAFQAR